MTGSVMGRIPSDGYNGAPIDAETQARATQNLNSNIKEVRKANLLTKQKAGNLTAQEQDELDRILFESKPKSIARRAEVNSNSLTIDLTKYCDNNKYKNKINLLLQQAELKSRLSNFEAIRKDVEHDLLKKQVEQQQKLIEAIARGEKIENIPQVQDPEQAVQQTLANLTDELAYIEEQLKLYEDVEILSVVPAAFNSNITTSGATSPNVDKIKRPAAAMPDIPGVRSPAPYISPANLVGAQTRGGVVKTETLAPEEVERRKKMAESRAKWRMEQGNIAQQRAEVLGGRNSILDDALRQQAMEDYRLENESSHFEA